MYSKENEMDAELQKFLVKKNQTEKMTIKKQFTKDANSINTV